MNKVRVQVRNKYTWKVRSREIKRELEGKREQEEGSGLTHESPGNSSVDDDNGNISGFILPTCGTGWPGR